ncbi:MAG: aminotransferase class IV [Candidatus Kerfeldbacteria bacterium]|nr:aminotransferase class IV [Candidatus Kerfeldbacteria bacterium]
MKNHRGVFETIRTYRGRPFELPAHLRRLRASARTLRIPILENNRSLTQRIITQCRIRGETRLKIIVTPSGRLIEATALRFSKKIYTSGVAVATYQVERKNPAVKSIERKAEDTAYAKASNRGYFDALLVRRDATIPEASRSNLFLVKHGIIYTANRHILYGITRAVILQLAKRSFKIDYFLPTLHDLYEADECFLTRTSTGIVPVVKVNRRKIGNGKPGPITKQLMKLFERYV